MLGVGGVTFTHIATTDTDHPYEVRGHYCGIIKQQSANDTFTEIIFNCENNLNVPTPLSFIRSCYGGVKSDWKKVSLDIPAFYKDYSTLASLSSAIGNNLYLKTGDVPNGNTTINIGAGLLLVFANTSMNIYFLSYWIEGAANVINNAFQQITVSKSSGSAYATIHNDNVDNVRYLMIGTPFVS